MLRRTLLAASRNRWLVEHLPRYSAVQAAARRFIPGEDLDAALAAAADLARAGLPTIVSRLGEDVTDAIVAASVCDHYRMALDRIASGTLPTHISVKLSHLGLTAWDTQTATLLADLAAHAARTGGVVWVDMEGSALTDRTIDIFRTVLARHRNIGICLQAYLHRTEHDLETLTAETTAIRLVKGAYNEPESIAWQRKRDVDAAFLRLALRLLELHRDRNPGAADNHPLPDLPSLGGGVLPALATHDFALLQRIMHDARERGVRTSHYEVQLLDGIRVVDRQRLATASDSPRVRVLVSYGTDWFPWFVRRLAERPANLALLARSLFQR